MYGWRLWCCSFIVVCHRMTGIWFNHLALGNLCQCSVTLRVKVFLDVQKELPVFQFVPIVTEETMSSLHFPFGFLHTLIRSSRTFSSPGWAVSALCLCSYGRYSSPLITFVALCWTLSTLSISLLLGRPELDTTVQAWPHLCWTEGKDHRSWSAGNTPVQVAQELVLFAARVYMVALLNLVSTRSFPAKLLSW